MQVSTSLVWGPFIKPQRLEVYLLKETLDSTSRAQGHWYISTIPSVISRTVILYQVRRGFVMRFGFFFFQHSCDFLALLGNLRFQCRSFTLVSIASVS